MESNLASQNLAVVSYKMATDPNYAEELARQIETGGTFTEEEAAALKILLEQKNLGARDSEPVTVFMGAWIG